MGVEMFLVLGVLKGSWYTLPCCGPVAQWIEQRPSKPLAARSNRAGVAIQIIYFLKSSFFGL